jgi:hypothetical protein
MKVRTLGNTAAAVIVVAALTGCVQHQWAYGPTASMPFEQASGQCKLTAMGAEQGVIAFGKPAFVGGAVLGNAIGNAVRVNTAYNACMEAQGFVIADGQQQQAAR